MMNLSLKHCCLLAGFALCHLTHAASVDAALLAVEPIDVPLPFFDGGNLVRPLPGDRTFPPLQVRLSRARYWAEDGHLDVLVQLGGEADTVAGTRLEGRLHDDADTELSRFALEAPGPRFMLVPIIPETLLAGGEAALTLTWTRADGERLEETRPFRVERFAPDAPREGRVPLRLDNPDGVTLRGLPVTTGVPFPRGVLTDTARLRLVDEQGRDVPLQVLETARWSKFGSIKWVLCDFTVDLDGGPRELFLEYGNRASGVGRRESAQLADGSAQLAAGEAAHRAGLQQATHDARHPTPDARDVAAVGRFSSEAGVPRRSPPQAGTGAAERSADGRPIREIGPTDRSQSGAVDGHRWASMSVDSTHVGFPAVDAGRLRFGPDGLWFDADDDGTFTRLLEGAALSGAFVEHEDGRVYRPDPATPFVIEEAGPEKIVIRRTGWYVAEAAQLAVGKGQLAVDSGQEAVDSSRASGVGRRESSTGTRFCRYVTRYVIHRGSPIVRVFHTWIFTGDGNRDRIRNMGWAFPTADGVTPGGFLSAFDDTGDWIAADALVQFDYDAVDLLRDGGVEPRPGLRAPGVARLEAPGAQLYFGVKDFWQHFPSELEFADGAFRFHNWPRHNRKAVTSFDPEAREDADWVLSVLQNRFAHEGRVLDFKLPAPVAADERVVRGGAGTDPNAQGISRTEEFWLYAVPAPADDARDRAVLAGLDAERLRATVDPAWVAASGAFYEVHPRDPDNFPHAEAVYEQVALAPARWAERLGIYGMWVHGDLPAWQLGLERRVPDIYRAYRKAHHAWPYAWLPFARSGDSRLLKWAEASTRQMIDANFSHYASDEVPTAGIGVWNVGPLPWASGGRPILHTIHNKVDYLLHAWHLTGYHRARDNLRDWAQAAIDQAVSGRVESLGGGLPYRTPTNLLRTYTEAYAATFDPWFLAAAHAIADGHRNLWRTRAWVGNNVYTGHREFLRFSGCPEYRAFFLHHAEMHGRERDPAGASWLRMGITTIAPNAYAWQLTGDRRFVQRLAACIDPASATVFEAAEPAYYRGYHTRGGTVAACFTSYYLNLFPFALRAITEAGGSVERLTLSGVMTQFSVRDPDDDALRLFPVVLLRKRPGEPLVIEPAARILDQPMLRGDSVQYRVDGPTGQRVFEGAWNPEEPLRLEVPAEAPSGLYRLRMATRGHQRLPLPVSPPGTPEIFELDPAENHRIWQGGSYWVWVPAELERFTVTFRPPYANRFLLASIWNPDGERVWKLHLPPKDTTDADDADRLRAEIEAPPEHRGRLWRIVNPAGRGFDLDRRIPPRFAVEPERWFNPGN